VIIDQSLRHSFPLLLNNREDGRRKEINAKKTTSSIGDQGFEPAMV
jgi:hypothetical protein